MKIKISVDTSELKIQGLPDKILNDRAFGTYAATTWHKLYKPYVPKQEGTLGMTDVAIKPWEIEHYAPYARYQYEGHLDHSKSENPGKASRHWDQAAAPTQLPRLASSLQQYIDSGRLKLD